MVLKIYIKELGNILNQFDLKLENSLKKLIMASAEAIKLNKKIIFFGNGGSASDAEHLATELIIKFKNKRKSFASIALSANTSLITACANDYNFNYIFERQLESLLQKGDIVIGFSTSGKSKNILKALNYAKKKNNFSALFTGNRFNEKLSYDSVIKIPSKSTARIQECHILLGHIFVEEIEKQINGKS